MSLESVHPPTPPVHIRHSPLSAPRPHHSSTRRKLFGIAISLEKSVWPLARCGKVTEADAARDRLRARGAIREEEQTYHDSKRRRQKRMVWVMLSEPAEPDGPTVVELPPVDPTAIASRYLVRLTA